MVPGIDVSHHNGEVDWDAMAQAGKKFCFIKCTEGIKYYDPQFSRNWLLSWRAGLIVGAYHFFHPAQDPVAQALYFLRAKGPTASGELPPVIDFETLDGVVGRVATADARTCLRTIEERTGRMPMVYGSPGFFEALAGLQGFEEYPLWVAHYGVPEPRIPEPWRSAGKTWSFWQTSDNGGMDIDLFNGDEGQLKAFVGL